MLLLQDLLLQLLKVLLYLYFWGLVGMNISYLPARKKKILWNLLFHVQIVRKLELVLGEVCNLNLNQDIRDVIALSVIIIQRSHVSFEAKCLTLYTPKK